MQSGDTGGGVKFAPHSDIDLIAGLSTCLNPTNMMGMLGETILQRPIFCLFKELSQTSNHSNERDILVQLLHELFIKQPRISYYFLYYMYVLSLKLQLNSAQPTYLDKSASLLVQNELNTLLRIYREFVQERSSQQATTVNAAASVQEKSKMLADANVRLVSDSDEDEVEEEYAKMKERQQVC